VKPVTLWYRWIKNDKGIWLWDYNHLEDDHCLNNVPTPKVESHKKSWTGGSWKKSFAWLDENNKVHTLKN
jgi:hypothetical protein